MKSLKPVPGIQIVGKGAKNRATAQRTTSEKDHRKNKRTAWCIPLSSVSLRFFTCFTQFAPSPLSECLEQANQKFVIPSVVFKCGHITKKRDLIWYVLLLNI